MAGGTCGRPARILARGGSRWRVRLRVLPARSGGIGGGALVMAAFQLTATWSFRSQFHIGTGLSGGGADRAVRKRTILRDDDEPDESTSAVVRGPRTIPEVSGDAIKGAIRGSAERMVRWLIHPRELPEQEDNSWPRHPALRRIFAWKSLEPTGGRLPASYRFS